MTEKAGVEERTQLKPGWKTTEFWTTVLGGQAVPLVGVLIGALPATWQAVIGSASAAVYALARGLAKFGIGRR